MSTHYKQGFEAGLSDAEQKGEQPKGFIARAMTKTPELFEWAQGYEDGLVWYTRGVAMGLPVRGTAS